MSTKAAPNLQIPRSIETACFRAICQVLRNDSVLGPATNTFVSWTDSDQDLYDPAWALCPWLKVSPFPTASDWITESQHSSPITLRVQLAVRGLNVDNLLNYFGAVRNAIFPQSSIAALNAVQQVLMGAGILKPTITLAGYGHSVDDEGLRILIADATIRFALFVGT